VRLPWTTEFDEQSARFALRFCCEECGHFDARAERCRHEWPTELHRRTREPRPAAREIVFCKEFELC
jgi:hypothetical protein